MVKQIVLSIHWNTTHNNKGTNKLHTYSTNKSQEIYLEWKKEKKDCKLYDIIYKTFLKWQKYTDVIRMCNYQGLKTMAEKEKVGVV